MTRLLSKRWSLATCQGVLALVWLVGVIACLSVADIKIRGRVFDFSCASCSEAGKCEPREISQDDEAWAWILPLVVPFATIICSYYVADLVSRKQSTVDPLSFLVTFAASIFYLGKVLSVLVSVGAIGNLIDLKETPNRLKDLTANNTLLAVVQVILAILVASFFRSRE